MGPHYELAQLPEPFISPIVQLIGKAKALLCVRRPFMETGALENFQTLLKTPIDEYSAPSSALSPYVDLLADAIDEHPDRIKIWLHWSTAVQEQYWDEYLAFCERAFMAIRVLVDRGIEDGSMHPRLDADSASKLIYNSANLIAATRFGGGSRADVEAVVDSLIDGYLNGYR